MTSAPNRAWLSRLSDSTRETMSRLGRVETYQAGQTVVAKGGAATHLYLIEEGQLELLDDTLPPQSVGSGEVVGETAFLEGTPRNTIVARELTRARKIDRVEIVTALAVDPPGLRSLIDAISELRAQRSAERHEIGRVFVTHLVAEALRHRAVRHPYLTALAEGTLPDTRWALADFARHYYGYSTHFPRYLTTVMSRLEDPAHRRALLENLTEEAGVYPEDELATLTDVGIEREWIEGVPHPLLFQRFRRAMGVADETTVADQVTCWRELFLATLATGSPAMAVGALGLGTENIVRTMYGSFVRALGRLDIPARDTVFFPLHAAVDDHHQATLEEISVSFAVTPEGRTDLRLGMLKALACRSAFWDWLYERALDPQRAEAVL